jgi:hypothetical protein
MTFVLLFLLSSIWSAIVQAAAAVVTVCPPEKGIIAGSKYHADTTCDRASYHRFKCSLNRHARYRMYKEIGHIDAVPDQKTVTCPAAGARVDMTDSHHRPGIGLDTVFFIENQSSGPIVISYVNKETQLEVSAMNPKITPATADPNAILAPGRWVPIYGYEGHEYVIREVLKTGVAGNVLLQHRAGLIPIGMNANADMMNCTNYIDTEPMQGNVTAPAFQRTKAPSAYKPCNTMSIGFRNVAQCPLHGYYVSSGEGEQCHEAFKFHLGTDRITSDFMWNWSSRTKYEDTFVGHTFHFRSAAQPSLGLIDTVTLAPIRVTDCPTTTVTVPICIHGETIPITIPQPQRNSNMNSSDSMDHIFGYSSYATNGTDAAVGWNNMHSI